MDLKTAIVDTLDLRPIKKATTYAFGALLQGIALGLFIPVLFPQTSSTFRIVAASLCLVVGVVLAVSAYSALKRKFMIVERGAEPDMEGDA